MKFIIDNGILPADEATTKFINKLKPGEVFEAEVRNVRNYQQLKMLWAYAHAISENYKNEIFKDLDTARKIIEYIKLKLGYVDYRIVIKDRVHIKTKSISYNKMSQEEFKVFLDGALKIMDNIAGYSHKDIDINNYMGDIENDN